MNEKENTALIQNMYDAFGRGDVPTILDQLTPDVEWTLDGPEVIPYSGKRVGHAQVLQFFAAIAATQENPNLTIDEFIAPGERVATLGRFSAVVQATGKRIDCAVAHVFTIRDGKVAKFQDFVDTAQMADAYVSAAAASR